MTSAEIILASASQYRITLLKNAGIEFASYPADIDERAVEKPLLESGMNAEDIAQILAQSKADDISTKNPGAWIIGCDQTLSLDGQILHKPKSMEDARRRLLALSGKTHQLNSAISLIHDNENMWSHMAISNITFRKLDPGFIGRHLASVGNIALSSVGAYQIEGLGVQLMEKIDGDFFSIMGLPLIPLLAALRSHNLIDE